MPGDQRTLRRSAVFWCIADPSEGAYRQEGGPVWREGGTDRRAAATADALLPQVVSVQWFRAPPSGGPGAQLLYVLRYVASLVPVASRPQISGRVLYLFTERRVSTPRQPAPARPRRPPALPQSAKGDTPPARNASVAHVTTSCYITYTSGPSFRTALKASV